MTTKAADPYPVTAEDLERQLQATHAGNAVRDNTRPASPACGLITRAMDSTPYMIQHT